MQYLQTKWKYIFTFSDFDYTGIKFACEMRRLYGTTPIFLTTGERNTINFEAKDLSDYMEKFGYEQTYALIKRYLEIGEDIVEDVDFITNTLKHTYSYV